MIPLKGTRWDNLLKQHRPPATIDHLVCHEIILDQCKRFGYAAESTEDVLQALSLRESDRLCGCSS